MLVLRGRGRFNDLDADVAQLALCGLIQTADRRAYTLSRLKHRWLAASHNAVAANNKTKTERSDQCCRYPYTGPVKAERVPIRSGV